MPPPPPVESCLEPPNFYPENLFLRCYANLRRRSLTLAGALPLMVLAPMLLMLILLLWLGKVQLNQDIAQQADRTGSALARQISASAAESRWRPKTVSA
ncbi:hypothetical protein UMZ34_02515 [Halopseudomonas pachastrellae]|nr:hypothetical protein UMZ34_02515 [Halopseudomonas pachastrellae]